MPTPISDLPPLTFEQACEVIPLILANAELMDDPDGHACTPRIHRQSSVMGILCPIIQALATSPACALTMQAAIQLGRIPSCNHNIFAGSLAPLKSIIHE